MQKRIIMGRKKRPMKSLDLPGTSTKNTRLKEEYDLTYYVHDRVELMHKVFSILSPKELKAIAPSSCSKLTIAELQEKCLDELLGMSSKRVCAVLDGVEPPSDTDSSDSDSSDEERSRDSISNKTNDVTTVCLDTESEEENVTISSGSRKKNRSHRKKDSQSNATVINESDKQKRAADRSEVTVLELLEIQARARAIRAQLQAEGKTNVESINHPDAGDDDDEPIEVKEEAGVIEISSDDERVKLEDQNDDTVINKPDEQAKETEIGAKVTANKEKVTNAVNTNTDKVTDTNKKRKKSKNKSKKKKKSNEKEKTPFKLQPIEDSIYEKIDQTKNCENKDETHQNKAENDDDDDVILIDDDFTVTKVVQADGNDKNDHNNHNVKNVIVRNIQFGKENVVISVPNTADNNVKIITEASKRLNSTVSKVKQVIEKKKLNSTVSKVSDKKSEKRKRLIKKKVARRDSYDDRINLELSDNEIREMEFLCNVEEMVDTDDNRKSEDGVTVVINSEEKTKKVIEQKVAVDYSKKSKEKRDLNENDKEKNTKITVDEGQNNESDEHKSNSDALIENVISKLDVDVHKENNNDDTYEIDTQIVENEVSIRNIAEYEAVALKNINISDVNMIDISSIEDIPLMPEGPREPEESPDENLSIKNINISDVNMIDISSIEDIPLMPEEPREPEESSDENRRNLNEDYNKEKARSAKTDSEDSESDSESQSENSSGKDGKPTKESDDTVLNKETCVVSIEDNDKVVEGKRIEEINVEDKVKETGNRELSEGEITDSSTDIEVTYLKPEIICLNSDDDDEPKKTKKKLKKQAHKKQKEVCKEIDASETILNQQFDKDLSVETKNEEITSDPTQNSNLTLDESNTDEIIELSDVSSCYEFEGVSILSKEPTAEEIAALSARIDNYERLDVVTEEQIKAHKALKEHTQTESDLDSLANMSWKDRYLDSKKVKTVMATANILNALRKKNIELKKKIEASKKTVEKEADIEANVEIENLEIGSIEHYNTLRGSTKYVNPVAQTEIKSSETEDVIDKKTPELPETNLSKEMKKDARMLLKMYKRLLKYNDMSKESKDPCKKKKKKKIKKNKRNDASNSEVK